MTDWELTAALMGTVESKKRLAILEAIEEEMKRHVKDHEQRQLRKPL